MCVCVFLLSRVYTAISVFVLISLINYSAVFGVSIQVQVHLIARKD